MSPLAGRTVAFCAPMKPPDHPVASGDRTIARLVLAALARAGARPVIASRLRTLDTAGNAAAQARLCDEASAEVERLVDARAHGAALWLSYHCHYKAPDLIGPEVARRLGLAYAIVEPSLSPRRLSGPWAGFARAAVDACARADRLFWTTPRDRPALEAAGHGARMVELPPFLDLGPRPAELGRPARAPLRLVTVAMMRPGDKVESYRRLAAGLMRLEADWRLDAIGDGPAREAVVTRLAPFGARVRLRGVQDAGAVRRAMEAADLLVWPGVGEGVGLVWLEAAAAGLPVGAEYGPAARTVVLGGRRAAPDDPDALAAAIRAAAAGRAALSTLARTRAEARHGLDAAAATLSSALGPLVAAEARA
ncbi:MAG: glycosyltransferase [Paracoccaceae bacterium]